MTERLWVGTVLMMVAATSSCRSLRRPDPAAVLSGQSAPAPQCDAARGFRGTCVVLDVAGAGGTSAPSARSAEVGEMREFRLTVPGTGGGAPEVLPVGSGGEVSEWRVSPATELFDRGGCLAEVRGGVLGGGLTPRMTLRLLVGDSEARTAHVELVDHRGAQVIEAGYDVRCTWEAAPVPPPR